MENRPKKLNPLIKTLWMEVPAWGVERDGWLKKLTRAYGCGWYADRWISKPLLKTLFVHTGIANVECSVIQCKNAKKFVTHHNAMVSRTEPTKNLRGKVGKGGFEASSLCNYYTKRKPLPYICGLDNSERRNTFVMFLLTANIVRCKRLPWVQIGRVNTTRSRSPCGVSQRSLASPLPIGSPRVRTPIHRRTKKTLTYDTIPRKIKYSTRR